MNNSNKQSKFIINYTLNEKAAKARGEEITFKSHEANSKKQIKSFLDKNKNKIYWFEVRERSPASKLPKTVISKDDPGLSEYIRVPGKLQTYYETGMEGCLALVLYRDDEPLGRPNPDFDPSKPEDEINFKHFQNHSGMHILHYFDMLEVDGVICALFPDHDFAKADAHHLTIYPKGFSMKELVSLFTTNKSAAVYIKK